MTGPIPGAELNVEVLREKYRAERDRRQRSAGTDQYVFAEGMFARFGEDPYSVSNPVREAVFEDIDVLVIGAGFGGISVGAVLTTAGVTNFRIVDRAADFGGTWYWNRYPGIRCDIESYIYLPFLEDTGYVPTERYVRGREIFEYCQLLGRHFSLYERSLFQTKVNGMTWNDAESRWWVSTDRGDLIKARFVTTQSGIFDRPQLPAIPGIEDFEGTIFHSARWDYGYTGGDSGGELVGLRDKRVGVIGTGATALQIVPELAKSSSELRIFQRTPTAVGVRDNASTDIAWFSSLSPGWQQARQVAFNNLVNGEDVDCGVDDGWTRFFRRLLEAVQTLPEDARSVEEIEAAKELADLEHNELVRARVDDFVKDPEKARLLKAYYRTMCKRPGFSDDYLPAMDRDNVSLVDVSSGIDVISKAGVVVGGVEYPLDCIVFATGFELGTTWSHRAGYDVVGRGGLRVSEKFAQGMKTFHGLFSKDFPNLFFLGLTQGGTTTNVPHMLREQAEHVTYIVARMLSEGLTQVEATVAAEETWQLEIAAVNAARAPFQEQCTPGYFNAEGRKGDTRSGIATGSYRPSPQFFRSWRAWRDSGDFEGLAVS